MPRVRRVSSRIFCLQRNKAFGAMRRFGSLLVLKLNPRNFRSTGRATALLASFTLHFAAIELAGGMGANAQERLLVGADAEPQEHPVHWSRHRTLGLVHLALRRDRACGRHRRECTRTSACWS